MQDGKCSLVLAAHGSTETPSANDCFFKLAETIGRATSFSTVTPAFLDGEPSITNVLGQLPPGDVVVVPVMTSEGYYFRQLPKRFDQNESRSDFRLYVSKALGLHRQLPDLIAARLNHRWNQFELARDKTAIVIVGHGTRKNKTSCRSTIDLAKSLRKKFESDQGHAPEIKFAFIDQRPTLEKVAGDVQNVENVVVVPFLIGLGPHTTVDVPAAFGLPTGSNIELPLVKKTEQGITIYDQPIGMLAGLSTLCVDLARKTLVENKPLVPEVIA